MATRTNQLPATRNFLKQLAAKNPNERAIYDAVIKSCDNDDAADEVRSWLQDFVKQSIAPYKYPRAVAFLDAMPRTETGKLQRFKLRTIEQGLK